MDGVRRLCVSALLHFPSELARHLDGLNQVSLRQLDPVVPAERERELQSILNLPAIERIGGEIVYLDRFAELSIQPPRLEKIGPHLQKAALR